MRTIQFGKVEVSRLVVGGNPFSGFSHQGPERDREMLRYYTTANIKSALHKAEAAGINTFFGRTDRHVRRMLMEYWDEGGTIQWFGQTASEYDDQLKAIRQAASAGAKGIYVHGGIVDFWYVQKKTDMLRAALETMRDVGVAAGFAGHMPEVHTWIRDNLTPDFQMCCYYNPSPRGDNPHHVSGHGEKWDLGDRARMLGVITTIPWTVAHYKIFAGGNKPRQEGWQTVADNIRENDLICVGAYMKENADMMTENVATVDRLIETKFA